MDFTFVESEPVGINLKPVSFREKQIFGKDMHLATNHQEVKARKTFENLDEMLSDLENRRKTALARAKMDGKQDMLKLEKQDASERLKETLRKRYEMKKKQINLEYDTEAEKLKHQAQWWKDTRDDSLLKRVVGGSRYKFE